MKGPRGNEFSGGQMSLSPPTGVVVVVVGGGGGGLSVPYTLFRQAPPHIWF